MANVKKTDAERTVKVARNSRGQEMSTLPYGALYRQEMKEKALRKKSAQLFEKDEETLRKEEAERQTRRAQTARALQAERETIEKRNAGASDLLSGMPPVPPTPKEAQAEPAPTLSIAPKTEKIKSVSTPQKQTASEKVPAASLDLPLPTVTRGGRVTPTVSVPTADPMPQASAAVDEEMPITPPLFDEMPVFTYSSQPTEDDLPDTLCVTAEILSDTDDFTVTSTEDVADLTVIHEAVNEVPLAVDPATNADWHADMQPEEDDVVFYSGTRTAGTDGSVAAEDRQRFHETTMKLRSFVDTLIEEDAARREREKAQQEEERRLAQEAARLAEEKKRLEQEAERQAAAEAERQKALEEEKAREREEDALFIAAEEAEQKVKDAALRSSRTALDESLEPDGDLAEMTAEPTEDTSEKEETFDVSEKEKIPEEQVRDTKTGASAKDIRTADDTVPEDSAQPPEKVKPAVRTYSPLSKEQIKNEEPIVLPDLNFFPQGKKPTRPEDIPPQRPVARRHWLKERRERAAIAALVASWQEIETDMTTYAPLPEGSDASKKTAKRAMATLGKRVPNMRKKLRRLERRCRHTKDTKIIYIRWLYETMAHRRRLTETLITLLKLARTAGRKADVRTLSSMILSLLKADAKDNARQQRYTERNLQCPSLELVKAVLSEQSFIAPMRLEHTET